MLNTTPQHPQTVLCRSCGYDLIGLDPDALCPECGEPVTNSLRSDALSNSAPPWIQRIRDGSLLLFWATLSQIILITVGLPGLHILFNILSWNTADVGTLISIGILALNILGYVGVWMLTTPEPRIANSRASQIAQLARWTMVSSLGLAYVGFAARTNTAAPDLLALILAIIYSIAWCFILLHARTLFLRMGLHARASSARFIAWAIPISFIACVIAGAVVSIFGRASTAMIGVPVFCGTLIFLLVLIVAGLVVLGQLNSALDYTGSYVNRLAQRAQPPAALPPDSA